MGASVWNPDGPLTPAEVTSLQDQVDALELSVAPYTSITPTVAGLALLDDVDAAAQLTTLGLSQSSGASNVGYISGVGGPLAVTTTTSAALDGRTTGQVSMIRSDPTASDVSWKVYDPLGNVINITGSTTDGFAEAHAFAQANNYALSVRGGGISPSHLNANVIAFLSSTRQTLGPCDSQIFDIRGVNFTFAGQGITSGTALTVDSFAKGALIFDGQVVCSHDGIALEFRPSTTWTGDAGKNQGVMSFFFRIVQNDSNLANACAVKFNAQTGESINGADFEFKEVNGGLVCAKWETAGTGVITGCSFILHGVHGFANGAGGVGLDVGTGISACKFDVEMSTPVSADYTLKTKSTGCQYFITDITSGMVKILLDSGAAHNEIHIQAPSATGLTLTDTAAVDTNQVYFNGALVSRCIVKDVVGDAVTSGATAGTFGVNARNSGPRRLTEVKAVHRSTNGTAASLIFAVRAADTLTDVVEIDNNLNVTLSPGAIAPSATNGFVYIPSCSGTPTGVPTVKSGRVPLVWNASAGRLYIYTGAAWVSAAFS